MHFNSFVAGGIYSQSLFLAYTHKVHFLLIILFCWIFISIFSHKSLKHNLLWCLSDISFMSQVTRLSHSVKLCLRLWGILKEPMRWSLKAGIIQMSWLLANVAVRCSLVSKYVAFAICTEHPRLKPLTMPTFYKVLVTNALSLVFVCVVPPMVP